MSLIGTEESLFTSLLLPIIAKKDYIGYIICNFLLIDIDEICQFIILWLPAMGTDELQ